MNTMPMIHHISAVTFAVRSMPEAIAFYGKLGFTLVDECEFEYPKGHFMRCNDWRLALFADS